MRGLLTLASARRAAALAVLAIIALVAPVQRVSAQESRGLDWYEDESQSAIEAENYETAVKILKEGIEKFPFVVQLNLRLADLYYNKELYTLALKEFRVASGKAPDDFYILNRIQKCHGYLNQNRNAVRVLERIITLFPESEDSAVDLGWMYFKTHQLEKGEGVLLKAMQTFGVTRSLSMTLGTIYSDMYRYNESKDYYLKSIQDALEEGDTAFAAVAYYNLSLLERGFYHYNSALRYTELSIGQQDRPTGHLSKGELLQSRLHFRGALAEYQKGLAIDDSPLTKVNMAILYQKFGLLDYARRYAEEVFRFKDVSWMHYFGTDRDLHMKELYELLADIYSGLSHTTRLSPSRNLWERLRLWTLSVSYRLKSNWYRRKFRDLTFKVGKDYLAKDNYLDAYWEFYRANEPYRSVALKYLHRARDIETRVKPHAAAYYLQEEGKVKRSVALLESSIQGFDRFWEKEAISDSLIEIARVTKRGSAAQRTALNRLYEINPGALRQIGYGIPLRVSLALDPDQSQIDQSQIKRSQIKRSQIARILMNMLRQTGSEVISSAIDVSEMTGFRYELQLDLKFVSSKFVSSKVVSSNGIISSTSQFRLLDGDSGKTLSSGKLEVTGRGTKEICYGLVTQLMERIYGLR